MYGYHVMVRTIANSSVNNIHRITYIMSEHSYLCQVRTVSLYNAESFQSSDSQRPLGFESGLVQVAFMVGKLAETHFYPNTSVFACKYNFTSAPQYTNCIATLKERSECEKPGDLPTIGIRKPGSYNKIFLVSEEFPRFKLNSLGLFQHT